MREKILDEHGGWTDQQPPEREVADPGRRRLLRAALFGGAGLGLAGGGVAAILNSKPASRTSPLAAPAATRGGSIGAPVSTRPSGTPGVSASATASTHPSISAAPANSLSPTTSASAHQTTGSGITYPGLLHTQADFDRMAAKVRIGAQPWQAGWDRLVANPHSQSTWKPRATATVVRGGAGENYALLYNDIHAAYQNALRWRIRGDTAHADAARDILNAWSVTLTSLTGDADRFLAAGIYGYQFACAADIMRGYPGFDLAGFQSMMLKVFYPLNNQFLTRHNGACITNYWANWDLCNTASILAIGVLCADQAKINQAVDYFKNGAGNGAITHAVPYLYPGGLGQWQESGRDQGHTMLGIGLMGAVCEMAWSQGVDLYGYDDSRFLRGCEYVAAYNLGQDVPFTTYNWRNGVNCAPQTQAVVSAASRGQNRPVWELVYNHYVKRKGLAAPNTAAYAARVRVEGGGGDYGGDSGGFDQLGFGTLAYTL